MNTIIIIASVFLDFVFGDPEKLPHPVRWIGNLISMIEKIIYPGKRSAKREFMLGFILCVTVISVTSLCIMMILKVSRLISVTFSYMFEVVIGYYCVAARSLVKEAAAVKNALQSGDITIAQQAVSRIVGRDTANLDYDQIVRATVETVAENITDGIISPLFYFFIGGPVAAIVFKTVSTMDSMIGYRNDRYRYFGTCAARLDDILNFIPARLTAFILIPLISLILKFDWKNSFRIVVRDRLKHESPNSAHGEAAVAGSLGIILGGGAYYQGKFSAKSYIGNALNKIELTHIDAVNRIAMGTMLLFVTFLSIAGYFFKSYGIWF